MLLPLRSEKVLYKYIHTYNPAVLLAGCGRFSVVAACAIGSSSRQIVFKTYLNNMGEKLSYPYCESGKILFFSELIMRHVVNICDTLFIGSKNMRSCFYVDFCILYLSCYWELGLFKCSACSVVWGSD